MTLHECALKAADICSAHAEAAGHDAGFDFGEFSGPAHAIAAEEEIDRLAKENGFTFLQVMQELNRIEHTDN